MDKSEQFSNEYSNLLEINNVIFCYFDHSLKVLVSSEKGTFSLMGEKLHIQKGIQETAEGLIRQKTKIENYFIQQVGAFGASKRHPDKREIAITYCFLVNEMGDASMLEENALTWVDFKELGGMVLDHSQIVKKAKEKLMQIIRDTSGAFSLLPNKFTLSDVQKLYENVTGVELDKRNFRKKILNMNVLVDTNEKQQNVSHRAAKLYSFEENTKGKMVFEF